MPTTMLMNTIRQSVSLRTKVRGACACEIDVIHLVEQKDEVDAEGHAQRQHSHVVEIPGKIILRETDI